MIDDDDGGGDAAAYPWTFRTDESSNEVIFIKLLEQGLGISVKGLTVLLWKESQERDLTTMKWSYYRGQRL